MDRKADYLWSGADIEILRILLSSNGGVYRVDESFWVSMVIGEWLNGHLELPPKRM